MPASEVIHYFKRDRPSQVRGVPDLASCMLHLRDLDDYEDAELVRKKIEACFSVFVTNNGNEMAPLGGDSVKGSRPVKKMEPGLITEMHPGDAVSFADPKTNGGYTDYMKTMLRGISSALGVTYEQLSGDLSGVNYSSIRAGLLEFRKMIEADQWQLMVPALLQPIMNKWVQVADMAGKKIEVCTDWTMPRALATDPLKEVLATKEALRGGLMSQSEAIREKGYDPDAVRLEMKQDKDANAALGLINDSDAAVTEGLIKHALDS